MVPPVLRAAERIALKLRRLACLVTNESLPQLPGAASFKRMLDGAPCPDARARRAHHEGRARLDLGNQLLGRDRANA